MFNKILKYGVDVVLECVSMVACAILLGLVILTVIALVVVLMLSIVWSSVYTAGIIVLLAVSAALGWLGWLGLWLLGKVMDV